MTQAKYYQKAVLLILLFVLIAGTYRFSLKDYEEECYLYKTEKFVTNYSFNDYVHGKYCIGDRSGYWGLNCSIITKYAFYNSTRFTEECIKYHLVRKA